VAFHHLSINIAPRGAQLGREERRRSLQDVVRPLQLGDLLLQRLELGGFLRRGPGPGTGVDLRLTHPVPQRLRPDVELRADRADRRGLGLVLITSLQDQTHGPLLELLRILLRHNGLDPSKETSLDQKRSGSLIGPAGQVHSQVKLLRESATNPRVRRALFEVEAESATFMGQLVWDVSQRRDHNAPIAHLDEAVAAARQARDPCTEAYATLRKSFVALYGEKDPHRGLSLAAQAAEVAMLASPSLAGLSLLHVAEGYAMTGDLTSCEEALQRAEAQFDRVSTDDVAAEYYTVNEFSRLSGSCYLFLDLPERAEPILRTTARSLAGKKKSQAIALGNLSLSLIRQRKLDEAAATLHRTIDAVELTRGGGGLNLAFAAGRELREWRHEPWVQDVNDRLLALMAAI
jgi:hypothetical protein